MNKADEMFKKADYRLEKGENYEIFKREVIGTNVIRFNYKSKTIVIMNTDNYTNGSRTSNKRKV